ncbi:sigma-54-dependent Fis family transcriptional regulator [Shewanella cyperi]|uniref:Sigma-54-dependent Fis family transcriptional regulator n=1 Tax=Shewanella cyperi TaxID=2814292 RepID=A0A975AJW1_9GAMM|nr:sigma-54 dependent transcriptional regulator [Shewanella cyperi]QSX28727.1 sigma-54-dependent Fis family transcriptional regulator [Shewanella cyperi]
MADALKILVVEDEPGQRELIVAMLAEAGHSLSAAGSVEEAIVAIKADMPDLVFSDWKLGQLSGMDLLNYVKREHPDLGFIIATAYGTISHAVDAVQAGADDYLTKPYQRQTLLLAINKVARAQALKRQNRELSSALSEQRALVGLVGKAPCMQQVFERLRRISATDATVLIGGESGTGKELAARALHQLSARQHGPFVAINCGAIPESLAEAELFGAEKGAFTGANSLKLGKLEAANGGTVFLDEIGELPLLQQTKLLRFLQEGVITRLGAQQEMTLDVRVIAATHRNLQQEVAEGRFREDLFYRLNVVPIRMPPLRERREDIGRLIEHFLKLHARQYGFDAPVLDKSTLKQLLDYAWPGNVRELSNRIERFVLLGDEEELRAETRPGAVAVKGGMQLPEEGLDWDAFERQCLAQAMARFEGNRTKAAKWLGMSYKAFLYRLEKHALV